jgi:hypothetical protein
MSSVAKPRRCVGDGTGVGAALGLADGSPDGVVVSLGAGEAEGGALVPGDVEGATLAAPGELEIAGLAVEVVATGDPLADGDPDAPGLALALGDATWVATGVGAEVGVGRGMKLGRVGRGVGMGSIGPGVSWLSQV